MQTILRVTPTQWKHWGKRLLYADYRDALKREEAAKQAEEREEAIKREAEEARARELARLEALPRYQPTTTDFLLDMPLEIVDAASFLAMYREIFEQQCYSFRAKTDRPYIIDGGANVGVSILYFKQLYPQSQIIAFEPDREVFSVLQRNMRRSGHTDVDLRCQALWSSETTLSFMHDGADGGRIAQANDTENMTVQTVRLRDYLNRRVDFLKLDVEGAETELLIDCADLLHNVEHLFVEYHSFADQPQTLATLIGILTDAGFRLHAHPESPSPQPFMYRYAFTGLDLQMNIFAFRV